jgi:UDP-N-acetylglucosamine 4,6-dehydratase/5-epimerase
MLYKKKPDLRGARMSFFKNKKVLIIGGTGTIGQGLLHQILEQDPTVVRIFSRDEHKQFEMQQKWGNHPGIRFLIGDVRDATRLLRAMEDIDYVFHAAAMKHVPACEYNPFEAVQTNILGTQNVIQASISAGVKKTVFTSTDKAIAPTNTYGASKLMAERLISAAQNQTGSNNTIFAAVRFGNVMGSRGSVIPLFKKQMLENGEITVTDPEMSRFMMTQSQATGLTMEAMQIAQGGEVFVLKMPVIVLKDLIKVVIEEVAHQVKFTPADIRIKQIGLRPGEKMFEELMTDLESAHAYELPNMFIIPNDFSKKQVFYDGAKKGNGSGKSYSSDQITPIAIEQVRSMVVNNRLHLVFENEWRFR